MEEITIPQGICCVIPSTRQFITEFASLPTPLKIGVISWMVVVAISWTQLILFRNIAEKSFE